MINKSSSKLYKYLDEAFKLFNSPYIDIDSRISLANYITNVYQALECLGDNSQKLNSYECFGKDENYLVFSNKMDLFAEDFFKNFIVNKEFHKSLFSGILPELENNIFGYKYCRDNPKFCEKDFYDIVYLFMKSIFCSELFDNFYKNREIYSSRRIDGEKNLGFTIFNPVTGATSMFINNFDYSLDSMNTLIHELGHGYDLSMLSGSCKEYNNYFYLSSYGEVLSRLFERLFINFLSKNNFSDGMINKRILEFNYFTYENLSYAHIFSLLSGDILNNIDEGTMSFAETSEAVKNVLGNEEKMKLFIHGIDEFHLNENINYTYGDIISIFLADEVEKFGFSFEVLKDFLDERVKKFNKNYLIKNEFTDRKFVELFHKQMKLIKK